MKLRRYIYLAIAAIFIFWTPAAHAYITSVYFNVYTQNDASKTPTGYLMFDIEIVDSEGTRPTEAVDWTKPFTVTIPSTPTATVYTIQLTDWEEWSDGFFPTINPATGITGGTIPTGTYKLTLTDTSGRIFTSNKVLPLNSFLTPSTITKVPSPTNPNVLAWSAVAGAQYYRIRLRDDTRKEPVYWYPKTRNIYIPVGKAPSFTIPRGVLVTGDTYWVQIEARDSDKLLNRRSRSIWASFTAP